MTFGPIHIIYPYYLLLMLVIPALVVWYIYFFRKSTLRLGIPTALGFFKTQKTFRQHLRHVPFILRMLILACIIMALTQPESRIERSDYSVEGIDIMLAQDISGSMMSEDFKPNRIEAAKQVAMDFIDGRPNDRIGLVVFSAESFLQCPLTVDHGRLKNLLSKIKSGMITDGTAIGDGLGLSVYHIRKSEAISKVVILLTDGINNTGSLDPLTAADIAKKFGIRVYTIGVGTNGTAPYPFQTPFGIQYQNVEVQIDEALLKQIAQTTGGEYFRATDKKKLQDIYSKIDALERSKIDVTRFSKGKAESLPLILAAAVLLLIELLLRYVVLKRIP